MRELLKRVKVLAKVMLGWPGVGGTLTVFPDDVFLVSYPRSGNTWTRFLIGNLVYPNDPVTFTNVDLRVPDMYALPDRVLRRVPRPRVLKSHDSFSPKFPRVIYVVRDPRDVVISSYHYAIKLRTWPESSPIDEFLRRFLVADINLNVTLGTWEDHVVSWLATRQGRDTFLLLRYEDMLGDPGGELAKVASFMKIQAGPERLARAVELSSADHMRRLEREQSRRWRTTRRTRQDKAFVRTADSGGWRSALPQRSRAEMEAAWGGLLHRLGYELSTQGAAFPGHPTSAIL